MTIQARQAEPLEGALRRIAVERIDQALDALEERDGRDVAIHTVRKECKRLRALLRLFAPAIGEGWRRECHFFRDLARSLSAARDAKVVLDVHSALIGRYGSALDPVPAAAIRQQLIADMHEVIEERGETPDSETLRRSLQAARLRARRWTLTDPSESKLERGFVRAYRRGRAAARHVTTVPHESNFHELRKRTKDFWYQLELLARRWPDAALDREAPTHRLAELLGDAHDLVVYRDYVERAASQRAREAGVILAALAERKSRELASEAASLSREVFAEKPKRFAAALGRRKLEQQATA